MTEYDRRRDVLLDRLVYGYLTRPEYEADVRAVNKQEQAEIRKLSEKLRKART